MQKNNDKFGYKYTVRLCAAIEKFTGEMEKVNPASLIYKGSNLKYALERALYFRYINDERLFQLFGQWMNDETINITVSNNVEKSLLLYMLNVEPRRILLKKTPLVTFKNIARQIRRLLAISLGISALACVLRKTSNNRRLKNMHPRTVFYVDREKFVHYLEPMAKLLDNSYVFCTYNISLRKIFLEKSVLFCIFSSKLFFLEKWAQKDDLLYEYILREKYDLVEDGLKMLKPKTVVIVEGNAPHDEIVNQICKKLGIHSICIQQGWSPIIHNGFRNMSYTKMLIWGDGFGKLLAKDNPVQKFVTTGNHNIRLADMATNIGGKITISFFIQAKSRLIGPRDLEIFAQLIEWSQKELSNVKIVVAGKGGEQLTERLTNVRGIEMIKNPSLVPLQDLLASTDIIVSAYSTVLLEAAAVGKLPIIFNLTSMPCYFPNIAANGAAIEINHIEEAKNVLKDLSEHKEKIFAFAPSLRKFRSEFFCCGGEEALRNIAEEIEN